MSFSCKRKYYRTCVRQNAQLGAAGTLPLRRYGIQDATSLLTGTTED